MAQHPDPRDTKKPEPRPAREQSADRKPPPQPTPKAVFTDWAMI